MSVADLTQTVHDLEGRLATAKDAVRRWTDANAALSLQAAQRRAENQGAGRGLGGMLFGSKYRAVARRAAAMANATIAKEVTQKRAEIAERKLEAQALVRSLQASLKVARADLKRMAKDASVHVASKRSATSERASALDLLHKLKEAHALGILTDEEYENKRQKLAESI